MRFVSSRTSALKITRFAFKDAVVQSHSWQ